MISIFHKAFFHRAFFHRAGFLNTTGIAAGVIGLALLSSTAGAQQSAPKAAPKPPAAAPAPAAPPAPPAAVKVLLKGAPEQKEWLKVCDVDPAVQKTICYTTRDFVAENNQPVLAVAIYEVKNDTRRFVRFLVPLTFMIPPGIRFRVEGGETFAAKYQICMQQGCFVEGDVNDAFLAALKKGAALQIDVQNQVGQEVNFVVPLETIGTALDGKGLTQQELIKLQEDAQAAANAAGGNPAGNAEELKKKGEELLKARQPGTPPKQ